MSIAASIALSGMTAASRRLEASARNVANVRSAGPLPSAGAGATAGYAAYVPVRVDQVESAGGTYANVSSVSPAHVPAYDPTAPYADQNGMVAMPNGFGQRGRRAADRPLHARLQRRGAAGRSGDDESRARYQDLTSRRDLRPRGVICDRAMPHGTSAAASTAARRDSRHSRNRPEPTTITEPNSRLAVGTSPQMAKPNITAHTSDR